MHASSHSTSWWLYGPVLKYVYFFQVLNGGLGVTTVQGSYTCDLPKPGYMVRLLLLLLLLFIIFHTGWAA